MLSVLNLLSKPIDSFVNNFKFSIELCINLKSFSQALAKFSFNSNMLMVPLSSPTAISIPLLDHFNLFNALVRLSTFTDALGASKSLFKFHKSNLPDPSQQAKRDGCMGDQPTS